MTVALAIGSLVFFLGALLVIVCLCVVAARADRDMDEAFHEHLARQSDEPEIRHSPGSGWRV